MKKGLTELVFILDRSGSMAGLESDTIGGYNAVLRRHKEEEGEALVSTVLFDDRMEVLHDRVPVKDVQPITSKEYYVRGCTALLDAVGAAIRHITDVHKIAGKENVPEKTIFVITTDGMENASRNYTYNKVRKMIERRKEKHGWEFLFLGANIDAVAEAGRLGIGAERAVRFHNDSAGVALNFRALANVTSGMRHMPAASVGAEWKEEIEKDFASRP